MNQSNQINVDRCLPPELVIDSAGSHLYRIGLSQFPFGSQSRGQLHHPYIVFAIILFCFCRFAILLLIDSDDPNTFIMIGDFAYFLKVRHHYNSYASIAVLFALISLVIHHFNYRNDITPSYLNIFAMISGQIPPQSVGLTNSEDVIKLITITKTSFFIAKYCFISAVPFCSFPVSFLPLFMKSSLIETLIFVFPWSLLFFLVAHHVLNIMIWQIIYFAIICIHLKLKLRRANEYLNSIANETNKNGKV